MTANDATNRNAGGEKLFRNLLRTGAMESPKPQLNSTPRPGDYELGSEESRAAARALLDAKAAEAEVLRNKYRVVVECIGKPMEQLRPTCRRYLCANVTLMEIVQYANSVGGFSREQVEPLISGIPIDGKEYELVNPVP